MKLGRRCPRASPYNVNCETTSALPFTSSNERFIFPCSSSKIRRLATFSATAAATCELSSFPTPSRIISPGPISPVTCPSTVTFARLTRCTTTRILPRPSFLPLYSLLLCFVLRGLSLQHLRQLRHIVCKHRQQIEHAPHRLAHIVVAHQPDGQHLARTGIVHQHAGNFRQLVLMRRHVRL